MARRARSNAGARAALAFRTTSMGVDHPCDQRLEGERGFNLHVARRRVNDAFLRDLIRDWEAHGAEVLAQVRREQPGTYMKVMAMLMPKEMKVETAHTTIGSLSDEQLQAMLQELQERILSGEEAKVINGRTEQPQALPMPEKPWRPRRTRKAAKALKASAGRL